MFRLYGVMIVSAAFAFSAVLAGCGGQGAKDQPKAEKPQKGEKPGDAAKPAEGGHEGHDHAGHDHGAKAKTPEGLEGLAELSPEDRALAEKQETCPVTGEKLGSMGKPVKVTVKGQTVFLCCEGCEEDLQKEPDKYLAKLKK